MWRVVLGEPLVVWITALMGCILLLVAQQWVIVLGLCLLAAFIMANGKTEKLDCPFFYKRECLDSLLNTLKCRIGLHHWDYEGDTLNEEGVRVCNLCSRRERGIWVSTNGQSAFIKWLRTFDV